jgi:hypothetical protein
MSAARDRRVEWSVLLGALKIRTAAHANAERR